jgi:hypothetical protein
MAEEHMRIGAFLKKLDDQRSGEHAKTRAALKTECVVVLTENHGHFVLDSEEIIAHLRDRHKRLELELKDYTVLGESVKPLRPSPIGTPS